jgi:hypothetical protein
MAIDILTDLLILTIPFRILWGVQIPSHKKAILLGVFSIIVATMCVSIIRVVMVAGAGPEKQSLGLDWMFLWSNVESAASKCNDSLPICKNRLRTDRTYLLPSHYRRLYRVFPPALRFQQ